MLGAVKSTFRETLDEFIDNFDSTNLDISYSWVNLYDITCVGFLLKYDAASEYESFYEKIVFMMRRWEETIKAQQEEISSLSFINDLVDYT